MSMRTLNGRHEGSTVHLILESAGKPARLSLNHPGTRVVLYGCTAEQASSIAETALDFLERGYHYTHAVQAAKMAVYLNQGLFGEHMHEARMQAGVSWHSMQNRIADMLGGRY